MLDVKDHNKFGERNGPLINAADLTEINQLWMEVVQADLEHGRYIGFQKGEDFPGRQLPTSPHALVKRNKGAFPSMNNEARDLKGLDMMSFSLRTVRGVWRLLQAYTQTDLTYGLRSLADHRRATGEELGNPLNNYMVAWIESTEGTNQRLTHHKNMTCALTWLVKAMRLRATRYLEIHGALRTHNEH